MKRWANVWWTTGVCVVAAALGCSPDDEAPTDMTGPDTPSPGIGFPGLDGTVFDMAPFGGGLVAGGAFVNAGDEPVNGIARWNGSSWSPFGDGVAGGDAKVTSLVESGGRLYVGGSFNSAGGVDAMNIAEWDGAAFTALGDGASAPVNAAIPLFDGIVFGGEFETIGENIGANHVAWYDGAGTWDVFGEGLINGVDGTVHALAAYQGDLIVGGAFGRASGVASSNVARWDGSEWFGLGAGLDSPVFALAEYEGRLYASGVFGEAIGPWQVQDVLADGDAAGANLSVAIVGDVPYVCYWDAAGDAIRVAIRDTGGWVTTTVATGGVGPYCAIAASLTGDLWVAYYDNANRDARYGYLPVGASSWQTGVVASDGDFGVNCDIAIGRDGLPVMCFDVEPTQLVAIAEAVVIGAGEFDWDTTVLEAPELPTDPQLVDTRDGAIVIDDRDRVHLAYYEISGGDPRYACRGCLEDAQGNPTDEWTFESFLTSGDGGQFMDITLDPVGRPTVSFFVQLNPAVSGIGFSGRDPDLGWAPRQLVGINPASQQSALVFNPITGSPSVAYGDSNDGGALILATRSGSSWTEDKVPLDSGENAAAFVGIGLLDGRDVAVLSYNSDDGRLRFSNRAASTPVRRLACWDGVTWETIGGINWWARDLVVFEGQLYAAGAFTEVAGVTANGLASWNGSTWRAYATNADDFVWTLAPYDGRLVVGGGFTSFGGQQSNHIAFAP